MPTNLIIFDADYIAELTSRMNQACELLGSAVASLKSATNHDGWKCKERTQILENFEELNTRLDVLNEGVNETTRVLGGSIVRFEELEANYEAQASGLSEDLQTNHGFSGTSYGPGGGSGGTGGAVQNSGAGLGAAGAAGAGGVSSASAGLAGREAGHGTPHGGGPRIPGSGARININVRPGQSQQGGSTNPIPAQGGLSRGAVGGSINLPVTHIPDVPNAAITGTKHTREVMSFTVNSVTASITQALGGSLITSSVSGVSAGAYYQRQAQELIETYAAGRRVFESSAAVIADPSRSHAGEYAAMASGLVGIAGSSSGAGLTGGLSGTSLQGAGLGQSAPALLSQIPDTGPNSELRSILSAFTGSSSTGGPSGTSGSDSLSSLLGGLTQGTSDSSGGSSFFDMIVNALKKALSGESSGTSASSAVAGESSQAAEFLRSFVMG